MHYRQITCEVTLISSDHYQKSSGIVDLAMGQIPYFTECVSSFHYIINECMHLQAELSILLHVIFYHM